MKGFYCVEWELNHIQQAPSKFYSFEEARKAAMELIRGQKIDIRKYTDPIRQGVNVNYRNAVADFVNSFFEDDDFFEKEHRFNFLDEPQEYAGPIRVWDEECEEWDEVDPPEDSLKDVASGTDNNGNEYIWLGSCNGLELICKEWFGDGVDASSFVELRCDGLLLGVVIRYKDGFIVEEKQRAANIFLVKDAIEDHSRTIKGIQATIREDSMVEISEKTIQSQIENLKDLGLVIEEFGSDLVEASFCWKNGEFAEVKKDAWGTSTYPMMVYLVLQDSSKAMKQQDIANAIRERFGATMRRQTIAQHVNLLQGLGYEISYDRKSGYKMQ